MLAPTPAWVLKDMASLSGLDNETISQQIVPHLESFDSSVKLKRHLEEFFGSTAPARAFTDKYINFRFPARPSPPPFLQSRDPDKPNFASSSSRNPSASSSRVPSPRPTSPEKLSEQFGANGKVYIKTQDLSDWSGISKKQSASGASSPHLGVPGSGARTPVTRGHSPAPVPVRAKGLEIKEAKPKKVKIGNASGTASPLDGPQEQKYPKSRETKVLEAKIRAITGETTADKDVEKLPEFVQCFCQVRTHPLSTYTPSCINCGLILCRLQQPHQPCPSCSATLLTTSQRERLVAKLYTEIEEQLAREQAVRDQRELARRERMLAESGGGHFPTLNGKPIVQTAANRPEARKVLTLGAAAKGKGKSRATMTTYSTPASSTVSPIPSATTTPSNAATAAAVTTVGRPLEEPFDSARIQKEWAKTVAWRKEQDRPWGDLQASKAEEAWIYMPKPVLELMMDDEEVKREARKKRMSLAQQGIGLDGRKVPGAV